MSWGPVEEAANLTEHFVHHEDVLRAQPGWTEPRELAPDYEEALWRAVAARGRLFLHRSPVSVRLRHLDGRESVAHKRTAADDTGVVLAGRPGELLLYAFGRTGHAAVEIVGTPAVAAAFRAARLGA